MENQSETVREYAGYRQSAKGRSPALRQGEAVSRREAVKRRAIARRRRIRRRRIIFAGVMAGTLAALCLLINGILQKPQADGNIRPVTELSSVGIISSDRDTIQGLTASDYAKHPDWTEDFLTVNEYSRPGEALPEVKSVFVHYTANRNTSAAQNRSYFESLKDTHKTSASAHFIIGYDGEIIQCVPLDEIAYAVQTRNYDSVSIECCYKSQDGSFTRETYDSLLGLLKWLMEVYDLDEEDILRHYDCGGKKCPLYYTDHPKEWEQLKEELQDVS